MSDGQLLSACTKVLHNYFSWFKGGFSTRSVGQHCLLSTPYSDLFGDLLDLKIMFRDNMLVISDNGRTYNNFWELGMDLHDLKGNRQTQLKQILVVNQIQFFAGELESHASNSGELGPAIHRLLEAIQSINGFRLTMRTNVIRDFNQIVKQELDAHNIVYLQNFLLSGLTAEHSFDFGVNYQDHAPKVIRTISSESGYQGKAIMISTAFTFTDLHRAKQRFTSIVLLDDDSLGEAVDDIATIAREYSDKHFRWSHKEAFLHELSAD